MNAGNWYYYVIAILVSLCFKLYVDRKAAIAKEKRISMVEGYEKGRKHERDRILGNFDATRGINKEEFGEIIDLLRSKGYELIFNPQKGGHDIRKQVYEQVIEVKNGEEVSQS